MENNFQSIEQKWQKRWAEEKVFFADESSKKQKKYILEMFPYPSGSGLHMGHALNFVIGDIQARFQRLRGFNVLHPMGFDALGLPAENAAIKENVHPKEYTDKSTGYFKKQIQALGFSYDWSRIFSTADPTYYRWDQWIFLKMFEKGLVYQREAAVNWCPSCNTIIANEQAQDGSCDRCKSKIQIKQMKQWFLKITQYADELYEQIDSLDWPHKTKAMQKNWIGKSHGTEILFKSKGEKWPIFTTRPDTVFGVTFLVIAANHPKLDELVTEEQKAEVAKFKERLTSVSEKDFADLEKEGVFTGSYATNPVNGEEIPIYAGNFVLAEYGSGMVMAVPAHDQRDFEFAKKYGIRIKQVISGELTSDHAFTGEGDLMNSDSFNGIKSSVAIDKITKWLSTKKLGKKVTNFRLRDWSIARQRYWGTPIPIIHCDSCGIVPVPESDLPVTLPKEVTFGTGNPLESNKEWLSVICPKCKKPARREASTLDTFANSSWYFFRYCDPSNNKEIFDKKKVAYWCPIDTYIGGAEHTCMHLIYCRFYSKFLRDLGLISFDEPIKKLFHQGMLHAEDGNKMSKSLGNVIDPMDVIKRYGVDALRFFLVSIANPDKDFDWNEKEMSGSAKFITKVFEFFSSYNEASDSNAVSSKINKSIIEVQSFYENFEYRKATIILREMFSVISKEGCSKKTAKIFLQLLNPMCPHITEELNELIGNRERLALSNWPESTPEIKDKIKFDLSSTLTANISKTFERLNEKDSLKTVYIYVIPFELERLDEKKISSELNLKVKIFAVNDENKYDPASKAKKAKPGLPSFYFE